MVTSLIPLVLVGASTVSASPQGVIVTLVNLIHKSDIICILLSCNLRPSTTSSQFLNLDIHTCINPFSLCFFHLIAVKPSSTLHSFLGSQYPRFCGRLATRCSNRRSIIPVADQ